VPIGYEDYARNITEKFRSAGVEVRLNLTAEKVSEELACAHVGIFLFPDGANERRGSLMAAMAHGVLCITTYSKFTSHSIREATVGVHTEEVEILYSVLQDVIRNLQSEENLRIVENARELSAKSNFNYIAFQLLGLVNQSYVRV